MAQCLNSLAETEVAYPMREPYAPHRPTAHKNQEHLQKAKQKNLPKPDAPELTPFSYFALRGFRRLAKCSQNLRQQIETIITVI